MNCGYREGWLCSQALHSRAAVPNFVPQGLVSWKVGGVDGEPVGGALELKGGGRQEVELRPASLTAWFLTGCLIGGGEVRFGDLCTKVLGVMRNKLGTYSQVI